MEFYCKNALTLLANLSFNSQQDGILPIMDALEKGRRQRFQFPTGWNSTQSHLYDPRRVWRFQFPTGWNSTFAPTLSKRASSLFQFPTGWNSTTRWLGTTIRGLCFNSQRDGILLCTRRTFWAIFCFNSQRDGILREIREKLERKF